MYAACGVNLNEFIFWEDNQNIFDGNKLHVPSVAVINHLLFFLLSFCSCQISHILQMHCWSCGSYSLHSVSYCGKHLGLEITLIMDKVNRLRKNQIFGN